MKSTVKSAAFCALLSALASANAVQVGVDPAKPWTGFMDILALPADGGALLGQSDWGVGDLAASFSNHVLTLSPNTSIARDVPLTDANWWKPDGSGNRNMNASILVVDNSLSGQSITFAGFTLANSLVSPYTTLAFIRDFVPDFSSFVQSIVYLEGGQPFSITLQSTPGNHPTYGFSTLGPNARLDQVAALGSVQVTAVPEPATAAMFTAGVLGLLALRRRTLRQSPSPATGLKAPGGA